METLYDLLGALPDDDAEDLRAAFRKVVKGAHPDINPDDPDAALKFRQILRASEILSDAEQRAAYDHLLNLAQLEQKAASKSARVAAIHRLATGVMVLALFLIVSLGGYMLFDYVNIAPLGPAQATDRVSETESATIAALATKLAGTAGPTRDRFDEVDHAKQPQKPGDIGESSTSDALGSMATAYGNPGTESIPAPHDLGPSDASYYREQAMSAYRNGDLNVALAYFNLAISYDPGSSDAYIDRAIVFHRLGDLKHAFADVGRAKRIDDSNRAETLRR